MIRWSRSRSIQTTTLRTFARPTEVADSLVVEARRRGGYFASRTEQQVHFKIPTAQAAVLRRSFFSSTK